MKRYLALLLLAFVNFQIASAHGSEGETVDDVLRHVPLAAAVAMKAFGVESRNGVRQFAVSAAASYIATAGVAYVLKRGIDEKRPDGSDCKSFPSGHAALAFAGATVLHKEYGHVSPWISVAGYTVAAATAVRRVARDRHYWHDVAAGAAIGVASSELSYWLCGKAFGKKNVDVAISPQCLNVTVAL